MMQNRIQDRRSRNMEGNWKHDRFSGRAQGAALPQQPAPQSMFHSQDDELI